MAETPSSPGGAVGAIAPSAAIPWLSMRERIGAAAIGSGALAVLLLASTLTPASSGMGTHMQLGMPPCTWPLAFGIPCPACGMTTAFSHAVRGDLVSSFISQPMGALLAVMTAIVAVTGVYASISGARVIPLFSPFFSRRAVVIGVSLLFAAWGWKIVQFNGVLHS